MFELFAVMPVLGDAAIVDAVLTAPAVNVTVPVSTALPRVAVTVFVSAVFELTVEVNLPFASVAPLLTPKELLEPLTLNETA